jgi:hypothetical protein
MILVGNEKHYVIQDLQTGDYSHYTLVKEIFESMVDDYMGNDWSQEEAFNLLTEFDRMTEQEQLEWVYRVYEYEFNEPTPMQVRLWEEDTGDKWEVHTGEYVEHISSKQWNEIDDVVAELDEVMSHLDTFHVNNFEGKENSVSNELDEIYLELKKQQWRLQDLLGKN